MSGEGAPDRGLGLLEWAGGLVPQRLLVTGAKTGWRTAWTAMMRELAPQSKEGAYVRPKYNLTHRVGEPDFPAEAGRYNLVVGNACPWCHRVLLALALRGLGGAIAVTQATDDAERASRGGWVFDTPEPVFGARDLREVYDAASPGYRGRCTAPLLVDARSRRAVNNESADLVRMLNELQLPGASAVDLYPPDCRREIDALNDLVYEKINNGVYKSGFATSQAAYDAAQSALYEALDLVEERLARHRFLVGDKFTEADLRLYPTIIRYDAVYAVLFKCCGRRVADMPNLSAWLADVYQLTVNGGQGLQVRDTFDLDGARQSYFGQLFPLNPGGIVPRAPRLADLGLERPPGRGARDPAAVFHLRAARAPAPAQAAAF